MIQLFVVFLYLSQNFGVDGADDKSHKSLGHLLVSGKCKKLWRHDELKGRCFGLTLYSDYKHLQGTQLNVTSSNECRALCCNLGSGK